MTTTHVSAENVCRVCLKPSESSKLLHQHPTIVEKLSFVSGPIQSENYAQVPDYICNKCEEELEFVYKFVVKSKLSKFRINSLHAIANAESSRNRDTQPFVKDDYSKPDFIDDIQMSEDVQLDGCHDNGVDKGILQMPPIESNSIIDLEKRPIRPIVVGDISKTLAKLETSPINYSMDSDRHAILDYIGNSWGKLQRSSIGTNSIIDLGQRSTEVLDDTELETSPIERNSIIDPDKRPIVVVDAIDKTLAKRETSSINYNIDPYRHAILDDIGNPWGELERPSINSIIDLSQRPTKVLDDTELEASPIESYSIIDLDKGSIVVVDDIDKPLADMQTSPVSYIINTDQSSFLDDIDKPWGKIETSLIGSNYNIDLKQPPKQVLDDTELETFPIERNSIVDLDKRPILAVDDIDKPLAKLKTSAINYSIDSDRHAILDDIGNPWGKLQTSSIGRNSIIDLGQRPTTVLDDTDLKTSTIESNSIIGLDKHLIALDDSYKPWTKIETSPTKSLVKLYKLNTSKHHTSLDVVENICHICGKSYTLRNNLVRHIREHEGRRFICTYENCQSFFTQRSSLKLHIAVHKGEKPFLCFLCNKKFTQRKSLQLHLKIHQGAPEHKCNYCNRGFHQKTNLVRHLKTRCFSKTKKAQCVRCKKYFASKQSLNRHIEGHESKKELITQPCVNPVQVLPINSNTFIYRNEQITVDLLQGTE